MKLSSDFVRRSLASHSWLGLVAGALMYVVCLSGTLAVFYPDLERWEQPYAPEFNDYDPEVFERAFNDYVAGLETVPDHLYLVLPTKSVPRARIATPDSSFFIDANGQHAGDERNNWTEMLLDLHLYLHLPHGWGMLVVSALGALLVGLIVSGFFAHPRIFRDAFRLRRGGSLLLEQTDIHNRLSVWGAPFHLVIAVTGAWFGLALPYLALSADAYFDGDRDAAVESMFGREPELSREIGPLAIASTLQQVEDRAPGAEPLFVVVHDAATPGQFISVSAQHPDRLIYSENYLFDGDGNFLRTDSISDGPAGKQVIYSIYRLHFGHFGGVPVLLLYGVLGLALTVVSATGINIWLARRKRRDWLTSVWAAIVWGLPLALTVAAIAEILFGIAATPVVWTVMALASVTSLFQRDDHATKRALLALLAGAMAVLVSGHVMTFGGDALRSAPLLFNALMLLTAVSIAAWLWRDRQIAGTFAAETAG